MAKNDRQDAHRPPELHLRSPQTEALFAPRAVVKEDDVQLASQIEKIQAWLGTGSINLFGRPFAGKDTQGIKLAELLGGTLIGGGDILRSHHDPAKIEHIMAEGGLIPSDYFFSMVLPYLSKAEFAGKPLILDSVGRAHGEEEGVIKAAEHSRHPLKAVVLLTLSDEEVWRRFEAAKTEHDRDGRSDDKREALKNRLDKFEARTMPAIEFYRSKGLLIEVNGAQPREAVTQAVLDALAGLVA